MKRKIVITFLVILTIIGAILATEALLNYLKQPKSLSAIVEANFPRPNYFRLFVTPEMGEYTQPLVAPSGRVYISQILLNDGAWVYILPNGKVSIMPRETPIPIFWSVDNDGNFIDVIVWVDDYGVWIDIRHFDESSDI